MLPKRSVCRPSGLCSTISGVIRPYYSAGAFLATSIAVDKASVHLIYDNVLRAPLLLVDGKEWSTFSASSLAARVRSAPRVSCHFGLLMLTELKMPLPHNGIR